MPSAWPTLVALVIVTTIGQGIFFPFITTIALYRANFVPKGSDAARNGDIRSIWAMFKRVKRLEGLSGFYRGFSCVSFPSTSACPCVHFKFG
jgi:hypothetical protein